MLKLNFKLMQCVKKYGDAHNFGCTFSRRFNPNTIYLYAATRHWWTRDDEFKGPSIKDARKFSDFTLPGRPYIFEKSTS